MEADITLQKVTLVGNVEVDTLIKSRRRASTSSFGPTKIPLQPSPHQAILTSLTNQIMLRLKPTTMTSAAEETVAGTRERESRKRIEVPKHFEVGSTSKTKSVVPEGIPVKPHESRGVQINEPKPDGRQRATSATAGGS